MITTSKIGIHIGKGENLEYLYITKLEEYSIPKLDVKKVLDKNMEKVGYLRDVSML